MTKEIILQVVSDVTGISKEDILSSNAMRGTRKGGVVFARYLSIAYCKQYNMGSISEIMLFHNRDRSGYHHALRTLNNDIGTDKSKWRLYFEVASRLAKDEAPPKIKRGYVEPTVKDYLDDEYQDITEESLKYQTNMTKVIVIQSDIV